MRLSFFRTVDIGEVVGAKGGGGGVDLRQGIASYSDYRRCFAEGK